MTEGEKQNEYREADWLHDAEWQWVTWHKPHASWDHDHCVFCHTRISDDSGYTDALRECWQWSNPDPDGNGESICDSCFQKLKETFRWTTVSRDQQPDR